MAKRKITCENSSCKHYDISASGGCKTCITIGLNGKCKSFEKGFLHYFHIVWEALRNTNFIDYVEMSMNPDLKTGLYYVMECYGLGFEVQEWGTCRMVMLKDGEKGAALNYEEITKRELNMEKFNKHFKDFNSGIMPEQERTTRQQDTEEKPNRDFGWVSPLGEFVESPFGTHEESAGQICEKQGFDAEYWEWRKTLKDGTTNRLKGDFIAEVKGYCLIHNPTGGGGYIATHMKRLTRKQEEFLYEYFMDKGDRFKAEQFIKETV